MVEEKKRKTELKQNPDALVEMKPVSEIKQLGRGAEQRA